MSRVVATQAYRGQYDDPIEFRRDEIIEVGDEDPEFRGWYWCRSPRGKQGWVHRRYLSALQGNAIALSDYSARELTVAVGTTAEVLERLDGWLRVRLDVGAEGWLPESHVQPLSV